MKISHTQQGLASAGIAALHVKFSHITSALRNYEKAIAAYDESLSRAPDDVHAHKNKANALMRVGGLHATLSQREAGKRSLELALKEVTRCLEVAAQSKEAVALKTEIIAALENQSCEGSLYRNRSDI